MGKKLVLFFVVAFAVVFLAVFFLYGNNFAVLNPQGPIALQERNLILFAVFLFSLIIVPVFIFTFLIVWKYREGNKEGKYSPDSHPRKFTEILWWVAPAVIILVLAAVTWTNTHKLDPFKALSSEKPLTIQVIALQWKWLFIYPEQDIASVNYIMMPVDKPVQFKITSDAPMNSFWIPELGGQLYAMTGMVTTLNLVANEEGIFAGRSANYSGEGFAHMRFTAEAVPQDKFEIWVAQVKAASLPLTASAYETLAERGVGEVAYYSDVEDNLYDTIVMKFTDIGGSKKLPSQASGHGGNAFEGNFSPPHLHE